MSIPDDQRLGPILEKMLEDFKEFERIVRKRWESNWNLSHLMKLNDIKLKINEIEAELYILKGDTY